MPTRASAWLATCALAFVACGDPATGERAALGGITEDRMPSQVVGFDAGAVPPHGGLHGLDLAPSRPLGDVQHRVRGSCRDACPGECRAGTYCCPSLQLCVAIDCVSCCPESDRGTAIRSGTPGACIECRRDGGSD